MGKQNLDEITKESLALRVIEKGMAKKGFIDETFEYLNYEDLDFDKKYTKEEKIEKLKEWAKENYEADTIIDFAHDYKMTLYSKEEFPLEKMTKRQFDEYVEKGTKMKVLGEEEIYIGSAHSGKSKDPPQLEILRNCPKGANSYLIKNRVEHWSRHEQCDSEGYSEYADITYYKIEK